jgi:excisionase family DNA binding protein
VKREVGAELLDVAGAAKLLGVSEKAVRARVARRQIPFRRLGARIIFRHSELIEFLTKLEGVGVGEALANATEARDR